MERCSFGVCLWVGICEVATDQLPSNPKAVPPEEHEEDPGPANRPQPGALEDPEGRGERQAGGRDDREPEQPQVPSHDVEAGAHQLRAVGQAPCHEGKIGSAQTDVEKFVLERFAGYLRDQGFSALQVDAVLSQNPARLSLVPLQLEAVKAFQALPEAESLAAANKRIVNILRKSGTEAAAAVDRSLFGDGAEHDLYAAVERLLPVVHGHVQQGQYTDALRALASARSSVDRFFDEVLVMADDPAVRANRLALLRGLAEAMNQVADISKLVV